MSRDAGACEAMEKRRVYYKCNNCGHERSMRVYEEDSWAAATHGTAESNREEYRRITQTPCEKCGRSGFSQSKGSDYY